MENKEILKALSFIAAELHIQNEISYHLGHNLTLPEGITSIDKIQKLTKHLNYYFCNDDALFNP